MELIDWRELYAANRAAIEGRMRETDDLTTAVAGGTRTRGAWERREHRVGGRARPVFVYTPAGLDTAAAAPLVIALHGCTQNAASFSSGSLLNRAADRHGFVVAYPEQSREDNPMCCWNWFSTSHQARGGGEPAFIAGATQALIAEAAQGRVDARRVYVVGMSAGGAMASVMAATYPDLFAALAVHSGLPYGCARTLPSATQAMSGNGFDSEALGRDALRAMGTAARPMPTLAIQGTNDGVVAPVNGEHVVRQWLATNLLAAGGRYDADYARPDETVRETAPGGRAYTLRRWSDRDGRLVQEYLEVEGLGHAWSGGAPGGSYADPRGPSAAEAIWDFFARVRR